MSDSNISSEEGVQQLDELNNYIKQLKTEKDQKDAEIKNLKQQIDRSDKINDQKYNNLFVEFNKLKDNDDKLFVEFNKLKNKITSVRNENLKPDDSVRNENLKPDDSVRRDGRRRRSKRKSPKRK